MEAMVAYGSGTMETIGEALGNLYGLIMAEIGKQQLQMAGAPFVQYYNYDEATGHSDYVAGVPVVKAGESAGKVSSLSYGEMKVVQAIHSGSYETVPASYEGIGKYLEDNSLEVSGQVFEFYLTNPTQEPDTSKWQTLISFLLK